MRTKLNSDNVALDGVVDGPGKHQIERTCIACRTRRSGSELVRFSVAEDRLVLNSKRRLPGRGAWLCPNRQCLAKAVRSRAFNRAFRREIPAPDVDVVWQQIHDLVEYSDNP
jgi:predicted RNA-binding protein YlxR (DUF448 family)